MPRRHPIAWQPLEKDDPWARIPDEPPLDLTTNVIWAHRIDHAGGWPSPETDFLLQLERIPYLRRKLLTAPPPDSNQVLFDPQARWRTPPPTLAADGTTQPKRAFPPICCPVCGFHVDVPPNHSCFKPFYSAAA